MFSFSVGDYLAFDVTARAGNRGRASELYPYMMANVRMQDSGQAQSCSLQVRRQSDGLYIVIGFVCVGCTTGTALLHPDPEVFYAELAHAGFGPGPVLQHAGLASCVFLVAGRVGSRYRLCV